MQLTMLRIQNKRVRLEEIQKKEGRLFISFDLFLFVAMHPEETAGGRFCRYTLKTRFLCEQRMVFKSSVSGFCNLYM